LNLSDRFIELIGLIKLMELIKLVGLNRLIKFINIVKNEKIHYFFSKSLEI